MRSLPRTLAAAILVAAAAPASAQPGTRYYWRNQTTDATNPGAWSSTFPGNTPGTTAPNATNALFFAPYPFGAAGPVQPNFGSASISVQSMTFGPSYDLSTPWTVTGSGLITFGGSPTAAPGQVTVRGPTAVTFDGPVLEGRGGASSLILDVGASGSLTLAGATTALFGLAASSSTSAPFNVNGGTLTLDNRGTNVGDRLADDAFLVMNGGRVNLIGYGGDFPVEETLAALPGQSLYLTSGQATFNVWAVGGQTATLTLGTSGAQVARVRAMLNFTNVDAAGAEVGTLGEGAGNPNVNLFFSNLVARTGLEGVGVAPFVTIAGAVNTSIAGFATINNRDFATLVNNSVVASTYVVNATNTPGSFDQTTAASGIELSGRVVAYAPTGNLPTASNFTALGLKITSDNSARTLTFTGSAGLVTNGLLLAGANGFTIDMTGTSGGFWAVSADNQRYVTVERAGVALELRTAAATATDGPLSKGGAGTLFLNGPAITTSLLTVNAGVVRVGAGASGFLGDVSGVPSTGATIELRGGVLELSGGIVLQRALGTGNGSGGLNWTNGSGNTLERGSGGFAAINGGSSVTIGTFSTPTALIWGGTAGFVSDGQRLDFGSGTATHLLDFRNPVNLGGSGGGYAVREVRVNDNPTTLGDVARLSGVLSGPASTDLVKTGPGVLELTGTNTYQGQTLVQAGTLRVGVPGVGGSVAGTGVVVGSGGRLEGSGTVAAPILARSGSVFAPGVVSNALTPSVATLTAGSGITVAAGATFAAQLNGTAANAFSKVAFSNTLDVTGATLAVNTGPGFNPSGSDVFVVAVNNGTTAVVGPFAGLSNGATGTTADGLYNFRISYFATTGGGLTGGNSIALYSFAVTPEPLTVLAVGAAGLGLIGAMRRRRAV